MKVTVQHHNPDNWQAVLGENKPLVPRVRVTFVTPCMFFGGAEMWILSLCQWLDPNRFDVTNIVIPNDVKKNSHPEMLARLPRGINLLTRLEDSRSTTDVYIAWGIAGLIEYFKGFKQPVVYVLHGAAANTGPMALESQRAHYNFGCHSVAVSEIGARLYSPEFRNTARVIPNGTDAYRLMPYSTKEKTREQLGIPGDKKIAMYIGRVSGEKNVQLAIDAIELLSGWVLVIAGQGMADVTLAHNTIRLPALRHIGDLLNIADVFVHPSDSEAHCLAVNEAWMAGVPTLTTEYPMAKWFNDTHGELSVTVPVRCAPEVFAKGVLEAAGERGIVNSMRAKRITEQFYSAQVFARNWSDYLWSDVMKRK